MFMIQMIPTQKWKDNPENEKIFEDLVSNNGFVFIYHI